MRYRKYMQKSSLKKSNIGIRFSILILIFTILTFALDRQVRPLVITYAQYQLRVVSILTMNKAIMSELTADGTQYNHLINVERTPNGIVSSIRADTIEINLLKAKLNQAVTNSLQQLGESEIGVPLGTILGLQFLAGRGPTIHFKIIPVSFVESEIVNKLESSGINQTQHQILIHMKVRMSAIIPGYSTTTTVENDVCIAETLIVGLVPDTYLSFES